MAKVKTKYGSMNEDKAATMFLTKVEDIGKLVKPPSNEPIQYKPVDLILDDRMWPIIAPVLKVEGQPDDAELDFEKVAVWFNDEITEIGGNDGMPMKKLSASETRKALMTAVRKRYAVSSKGLAAAKSAEAKELEAAKSDEAKVKINDKWKAAKAEAKAKRDEALAILNKQGWTAMVVKRSGKSLALGKGDGGGKQKADVKLTSQTKDKTDVPGKKPQPQASKKTEGEDGGPFYTRGFGKPVEAELLKLNGKFDKKEGKWMFPDAASRDKAQKLIDDFAANKPAK